MISVFVTLGVLGVGDSEADQDRIYFEKSIPL